MSALGNSTSLLDEADLFKATTNSDLVVQRRCKLYNDRFVTFHDYAKDPEDNKTWYLDRRCVLEPLSAADVRESTKCIRPIGTWTITATIKSKAKGQPVKLYHFTIIWAAKWAAQGYTSFTMGFSTPEEARHWHTRISECITNLKSVRNMTRTFSTKSKHELLTYDEKGAKESALENGTRLGSAYKLPSNADAKTKQEEQFVDADESAFGDGACDNADTFHDDAASSDSDSEAQLQGSSTRRPGSSGTGTDGKLCNLCADFYEERHTRSATRSNVQQSVNQRWVPFKQVNGVAIYRHRWSPQGEEERIALGGEYMVSAIVRGTPRECMKVLVGCGVMNSSFLGPALKIEVLERRRPENMREVVRITLRASRMAGVLCAPREIVMESVIKVDETGPSYVIMFNSCEPPARFKTSGEKGDSRASSFVGGICSIGSIGNTPGDSAPQEPELPEATFLAAESSPPTLFKKPVMATVQGGYTVSPLENHNLETSPESLITCIIKVDLGGVCSDRSWFRLGAYLFGWTDAFLDRILMNVMLIRDEVEQSKFAVKPDVVMSSLSGGKPPASPGAAPQAPAQPGRGTKKSPAGRSAFVSARAGDAVADAAVEPLPSSVVSAEDGKSSLVHNSSGLLRFVRKSASPEYVIDYAAIAAMATLDQKRWDNLHQPQKDAPFKVRGPTYLKDHKKIPAGMSRFVLGAMDVIEVPERIDHVARFLPSIRQSRAPFTMVINLVIPGTPLLGIVASFVSDRHPRSMGKPPTHPMEDDHDWEPFDFVLHKYMTSDSVTRARMLKLIPHIADGSWMIKQSVGTTPVILGKQLSTTYYETPTYLEIDIDISCNSVAAYVTGLVRGATKNLVIDMGFVLEGTVPWELPEALMGTLRLYNLDIREAKKIDITKEIPLLLPIPVGGDRSKPEAVEASAVDGGGF